MLEWIEALTLKQLAEYIAVTIGVISLIVEWNKKIPWHPWSSMFAWIGKQFTKGIDEKIATYLKDGVDVEEFATTFNSILSDKAKAKGFVPTEHPTGDNITVEQFKAMSYDKLSELYTKNPTLYEKLSKKVK